MKRIIVVLALLLLCTMPAAAMTSTLELHADKERLGEKEQIAVTVEMNEPVTGEFRNLQGQLAYDTEIFSYVSHEMGEAYNHYGAADMAQKGFFTFSNTDFTDKGFSEIQEGTLVTIVFETKEKLKRKDREVNFVLTVDLQDTSGISEAVTREISLQVSGKDNAGRQTDAGQNDTDQTKSAQTSAESLEKPAKTENAAQGDEDLNPGAGIAVAGAGLVLAYFLYRIWGCKKEKGA